METDLELLSQGGPFLVALILALKMFLESKQTANQSTYGRDVKRLERAIEALELRQSRSLESFNSAVRGFTSCVEKLSGKLDLHAKTLEIINGNLEKISDRLTHLERKS